MHIKYLEDMTESRWASESQIREANRYANRHFFDTDTMRFFASRVLHPMYYGRIFVTSEKSGFDDPTRRYTVRRQLRDGTIESLDDFLHYGTSRAAHKAAAKHSANAQLRDHLAKLTA